MTQQMSLKAGTKKFGKGAIDAMKKELNQMHSRDSFTPRLRSELTEQQLKNSCEAVNSTKEKKNKDIKG